MLQPKDIDWLNGYKREIYIYAVYKRPASDQGHIQTENEGMEKYIPCKYNQKNAGVAIHLSDKINFEIKAVTRDKEGHYTVIKRSIQEDITIINKYAPNMGAPQYTRHILTAIKGVINSNTVIVGEVNTPLTPMDRSSRQKINKETQALNDIHQRDFIDTYRTHHPKTAECNFYASAHRTVYSISGAGETRQLHVSE